MHVAGKLKYRSVQVSKSNCLQCNNMKMFSVCKHKHVFLLFVTYTTIFVRHSGDNKLETIGENKLEKMFIYLFMPRAKEMAR